MKQGVITPLLNKIITFWFLHVQPRCWSTWTPNFKFENWKMSILRVFKDTIKVHELHSSLGTLAATWDCEHWALRRGSEELLDSPRSSKRCWQSSAVVPAGWRDPTGIKRECIRVIGNFARRLQVCRERKGAHLEIIFEHAWKTHFSIPEFEIWCSCAPTSWLSV